MGDVLGGCFGMYFGNLPLFTMITLIVFSPLIVLQTSLRGESEDASYLLSFLNIILSQVATAALIYGVFRKLKKKKAALGRCLAVGLERLFPLLGAAIVIGIASGLPMIIAMLIAFAVSPVLGGLLIIPAFIIFMMIYVALAMTAPAIVVESAGVFDGIGLGRGYDTGIGSEGDLLPVEPGGIVPGADRRGRQYRNDARQTAREVSKTFP